MLSAALDSSVAIAAVIIFFAVFWTQAADRVSWWGTEVYKVRSHFTRSKHVLIIDRKRAIGRLVHIKRFPKGIRLGLERAGGLSRTFSYCGCVHTKFPRLILRVLRSCPLLGQ